MDKGTPMEVHVAHEEIDYEGFNYDDEKHEYSLMMGGITVVIPSVSQILQSTGMYRYPGGAEAVKKMNRGTHYHKLTELLDNDVVTADDFLDEEREIALLYKRFIEETGYTPLLAERPLYHPKHLYAGKFDRIALFNKLTKAGPFIVDFKFGSPHPANHLQTAAYHELVVANKSKLGLDALAGACCVYFNASRYKVVENQEIERNFDIFLACHKVRQWQMLNLGGR